MATTERSGAGARSATSMITMRRIGDLRQSPDRLRQARTPRNRNGADEANAPSTLGNQARGRSCAPVPATRLAGRSVARVGPGGQTAIPVRVTISVCLPFTSFHVIL